MVTHGYTGKEKAMINPFAARKQKEVNEKYAGKAYRAMLNAVSNSSGGIATANIGRVSYTFQRNTATGKLDITDSNFRVLTDSEFRKSVAKDAKKWYNGGAMCHYDGQAHDARTGKPYFAVDPEWNRDKVMPGGEDYITVRAHTNAGHSVKEYKRRKRRK